MKFKPELLNVDLLIKKNELPVIINPTFFERENVPSVDGLLSNEIFGITKDDRANKFAYIDLGDYFLNPLIYKKWSRMDSKVKYIIYGLRRYKIDSKGQFIEDENGETGIRFLKDNIDKIKILQSDSRKRDVDIDLIMRNKDKIFINRMIVIPAYYRDINTSGDKHVGVGDLNKLYSQLLIFSKSIKETQDYGIEISDTIRARLQETLVNIYNWFINGSVNGETVGTGLSKKEGIIKRAVMAKTTDLASRLIISAPEIRVERYTDLKVNLDYTAVPLASLCTNLLPFIIFHMRRILEKELPDGKFAIKNKKGELEYITLKDPRIEFSDERLKKEINRFIRGFSNRFIPILIPNEEGKKVYLKFKGYKRPIEDAIQNNTVGDSNIVDRYITWCDLIYQSAVEAARGKHILATRYPMNDHFGQFPTKITVLSTKDTEPMFIDGKFYDEYPKIRQEDIGKNTSNKFQDTLQLCNLFLAGLEGDYKLDPIVVFSY